MDAALATAVRWVHIAVLLDGLFYARVVVGDLVPGFKPVGYWAIGGILAPGIYNFLSKNSVPSNYQLWLGIKVLLALHVFAATILYCGKKQSLTGVVTSGGVILIISEYLRWSSLKWA